MKPGPCKQCLKVPSKPRKLCSYSPEPRAEVYYIEIGLLTRHPVQEQENIIKAFEASATKLEQELIVRVLEAAFDEGLPGVLGNKGTLAKYRREQENISQFLGTGEQNSKKLQYENILI